MGWGRENFKSWWWISSKHSIIKITIRNKKYISRKKLVIIELIIIKKIVKSILWRLNLSTYGNLDKKNILEVINLLKPHNLGYDLIHLGGSKDGSYILPKILNDIEYCFSAGYGGN